MNNLSYKSIIAASWELTKSNYALLLVSFAFPIIFQSITSTILRIVPKDHILISFILLSIANTLFSLVIQLGVLKVLLNIIDNNNPQFSDLVSQSKKIVKYFLTSILLGISFIIPTVIIFAGYFFVISYLTRTIGTSLGNIFVVLLVAFFLVLALFYISMRFRYYPQILVDHNTGIIESLKQSWRITKGCVRRILILDMVLLLINIAGFLCLFFGLFLTIPLSLVATTLLYRRLSPQSQAIATSHSTEILSVISVHPQTAQVPIE